MQGKEIPDVLAARALSPSNAGGAKGTSWASAIPHPESNCLILVSCPKGSEQRLVGSLTRPRRKAGGHSKHISLAPIPAGPGQHREHLEMEGAGVSSPAEARLFLSHGGTRCTAVVLLLLLPALDHWYFEVIFVARRMVCDCFRESSARNLVDLKKMCPTSRRAGLTDNRRNMLSSV